MRQHPLSDVWAGQRGQVRSSRSAQIMKNERRCVRRHKAVDFRFQISPRVEWARSGQTEQTRAEARQGVEQRHHGGHQRHCVTLAHLHPRGRYCQHVAVDLRPHGPREFSSPECREEKRVLSRMPPTPTCPAAAQTARISSSVSTRSRGGGGGGVRPRFAQAEPVGRYL